MCLIVDMGHTLWIWATDLPRNDNGSSNNSHGQNHIDSNTSSLIHGTRNRNTNSQIIVTLNVLVKSN